MNIQGFLSYCENTPIVDEDIWELAQILFFISFAFVQTFSMWKLIAA